MSQLSQARTVLMGQLKEVDEALALLTAKPTQTPSVTVSASSARRRGPKAVNTQTLPEAVLAVLLASPGPMRVKDIGEAVIKGGYQTSSKSFGTQISQLLNSDPRFRKVDRGLFILDTPVHNG